MRRRSGVVAVAVTTALLIGPLAACSSNASQTATSSTPLATSTTRPATTTSSTTTTEPATTTTTAQMALERRVNILLLGGDAGPDRWKLRTDTMVVASIDPVTGDTAMISVPRNLPRIEFPPGTPLAARFPDGFDAYDGLTNAVYTFVDIERSLTTGAEDAGAQAVKLGISQFLGIPIQYYVLVDMAGFSDVVNVLGGIDVYVTKRVPAPDNPLETGGTLPKYFEIGWGHFDGTFALSYARSRKADSDYWRMGRQRCVLAGLFTAAAPLSLAGGLPALVSSFGAAVHTDIPTDQLDDIGEWVRLLGEHGGVTTVRTLHVAPPSLESTHWRSIAQYIRDVVSNTLVPGIVPGVEMPPGQTLVEQCNLG